MPIGIVGTSVHLQLQSGQEQLPLAFLSQVETIRARKCPPEAAATSPISSIADPPGQ